MSNFLLIESNIQRPTNELSTLLIVGVSEMGRMSSCMDFGGCCFGMGKIAFQHSGKIPCRIDAMNILHIGSDNAKAKSRRNQLGIPLGPGGFRILMFNNLWMTSIDCIIKSSGTVLVTHSESSDNGVKSLETEAAHHLIG